MRIDASSAITALSGTQYGKSLDGLSGERKDAKSVAESFESIFLGMLLEPLEKAGESFFGKGTEGRIFGGMFRTQMADQLAKQRPLGIADQIEASLARRAMNAPTAGKEETQ